MKYTFFWMVAIFSQSVWGQLDQAGNLIPRTFNLPQVGLIGQKTGAQFIASGGASARFARVLSRACGANGACWQVVRSAMGQSTADVSSAQKAIDGYKQATCQTGAFCNNSGGSPTTDPTSGGDDDYTVEEGALESTNYGDGNGEIINNYGMAGIQQAMRGVQSDLNNLKSSLDSSGISFDDKNKTVTTPQGTFAMGGSKNIGDLDAETAKMIADAAKQAEKEFKEQYGKLLKGGEGEGGAGGLIAPRGKDTSDKEWQDYLARMLKRKPAQESLAGLAVMRNGEPIGISQSNIFETMSKRYEKLKQNGQVGL